MADSAEPRDTTMQHAATHASTMPDPPTLTPSPTPTPIPTAATCPPTAAAVHPPDPASPPGTTTTTPTTTARPAPLSISTSDPSSSTNNPAAGQDDSTPPTSIISSQEESQEARSPTKIEAKQEALKKTTTVHGQQRLGSTSSQSPPSESMSGTKRTASGQVKRASINGLGDVIPEPTNDPSLHPRTSSMTSNGPGPNGNVLELSQQLRTKLKYAMLKVQNGWQSRSFDEVESLASQSPRSTVSGFHPSNNNDPQNATTSMLSPKTAMMSMSRRQYQRESSESGSSDNSTVAPENRGVISMTNAAATAATGGTPARRSLAPPVDIMPGNSASSSRRRPTPNAAYLHQPSRNSLHASASNGQASRAPTTSQRTPSQNAAMEADAVETLLFMASPNNSGYNNHNHNHNHSSQESSLRSTAQAHSYPPTSSASTLTSPLRTQFSQTSMTSPKRVAFSDVDAESSSTEQHVVFDKAALIDRILDELSDTSDDELEQAFRLADKSKPKPAAAVSS